MKLSAEQRTTCPYRKLDPAVLVMEATDSRNRYNPTEPPDRPMDWSILAQRLMSASLIIVGHIRPQDSPQVGFPEDDHMVKAFPSDRADESLDISVLPWRPRCRWSIPDAHCSQTPHDCIAVNRILISKHVLRRFIPREGINYL